MLTCGGLVVVFELAGGQRVRNRVAVLVRYMVSEFVEDSIVPAGLAEEGGRVLAVVDARALYDQLVVDRGREAAPAPSCAATAHEKLMSLIFCLQPAYAWKQLSWRRGTRGT